ncbi:MAG: hypothetical protein U0787_12825 [Polyangia bacterium]
MIFRGPLVRYGRDLDDNDIADIISRDVRFWRWIRSEERARRFRSLGNGSAVSFRLALWFFDENSKRSRPREWQNPRRDTLEQFDETNIRFWQTGTTSHRNDGSCASVRAAGFCDRVLVGWMYAEAADRSSVELGVSVEDAAGPSIERQFPIAERHPLVLAAVADVDRS